MKTTALALFIFWVFLGCSAEAMEEPTLSPITRPAVVKPTAAPTLAPTLSPRARAPVRAIRATPAPSRAAEPTREAVAQATGKSPYAYEVIKPSSAKNVLGSPDDSFFSLGGDGRELDVKIRVRQGPGPDLRVIECGKNCNYPGNPKDEPFDTYVWVADGYFQFVGHSSGGVSDFDLEGIVEGDVEIVRVVSRIPRASGKTPGPDIDAFVALQSVPAGYSPYATTPSVSVPTVIPTPTAQPAPEAVPTQPPSQAATPVPIPGPTPVKARGNDVVLREAVSVGEEIVPGENDPRVFELAIGGCGCKRSLDVQFSPKQGDLRLELHVGEQEGPVAGEGREFDVPDHTLFVYLLVWADPGASPGVATMWVTMKENGDPISITTVAQNLNIPESLSWSLYGYNFDEDRGVEKVTLQIRNKGKKPQKIKNLEIVNCSFATLGKAKFFQIQDRQTVNPKKEREISAGDTLFLDVELTVPEGVEPSGRLYCQMSFDRIVQKQKYDPESGQLVLK